jgi:hypothetical protein
MAAVTGRVMPVLSAGDALTETIVIGFLKSPEKLKKSE